MIELKNISKVYRAGVSGVQALQGVSLTIHPGEFVAIMGPSGSGKSTLLHIIGLLDRPDNGSYFLFGNEVSRLSDDRLAFTRSRYLGFVFQQFHLLPRMKAVDNVMLPLIYAGGPGSRQRAMEKIASVGLEDRALHRPNELSGGQQQRVSIARALVNDPLVILADEPTGNLDSKSGKDVLELLKKLNDEGKTVVMVTHDPEMAHFVKRVVRMKDGQILSDELQKKAKQFPDGSKSLEPKQPVLKKNDKSHRRMNMAGYLRQSLQAIFSNKMRSFLSMLGILIGVAAVIAMLALGEGARKSVTESLASLGSNLLVIRPGSSRMHGVSLESGLVTRFTFKDCEDIGQLPQVKSLYPEVSGRVQVVYGNRNWSTSLSGTGVDYAVMRASVPVRGRFFNEAELRSRQKVAVLGSRVADELFGDKDPVGETVKINRIYFKVIGVLPEKGAMGPRDQDDVMIIPVTTAMYRVLGKDYIDSISVEVRNIQLMEEAKEAITQIINRLHRLKGDEESFNVRDMTEIQNAFKNTTMTMTILLGSIAGISLLVGGIGIMNIMLVSVTERTREIGLRKAIGARKRDIMMQFLVEAVVLTLSGGIIGIALGTGISVLLSRIAGWTVSVTGTSLLLASSFSVAIGVGFGLWPARQASRLNPIEALRYE